MDPLIIAEAIGLTAIVAALFRGAYGLIILWVSFISELKK